MYLKAEEKSDFKIAINPRVIPHPKQEVPNKFFIGQIERAKGIPSLETLVKIANVLETSTDSLLFGDLNTESGKEFFIKKNEDLTKNYTSKEKEILIKNIELINELKQNNEKSSANQK